MLLLEVERNPITMSDKYSRSGGKYTGNHTTLSPLAATVCDIANKCDVVTKISPGFLKAGLRSVNGQRRVKITDKNGGGVIVYQGQYLSPRSHYLLERFTVSQTAHCPRMSQRKNKHWLQRLIPAH